MLCVWIYVSAVGMPVWQWHSITCNWHAKKCWICISRLKSVYQVHRWDWWKVRTCIICLVNRSSIKTHGNTMKAGSYAVTLFTEYCDFMHNSMILSEMFALNCCWPPRECCTAKTMSNVGSKIEQSTPEALRQLLKDLNLHVTPEPLSHCHSSWLFTLFTFCFINRTFFECSLFLFSLWTKRFKGFFKSGGSCFLHFSLPLTQGSVFCTHPSVPSRYM